MRSSSHEAQRTGAGPPAGARPRDGTAATTGLVDRRGGRGGRGRRGRPDPAGTGAVGADGGRGDDRREGEGGSGGTGHDRRVGGLPVPRLPRLHSWGGPAA